MALVTTGRTWRNGMNELFRFIAVEAAPVDGKPGLIDGGKMVKGSQLARELHGARETDRAAVAVKYMEGDRFVEGSDPGLHALLRLAAAFKGPGGPEQEAFEQATQEVLGRSVVETASDEDFSEFERRLAESLLACRHAGRSAPRGLGGQLALALRVTTVIEAVAGESPRKDDILARPWAQMIVFDGLATGGLDQSRSNGAGAFSHDGEGSSHKGEGSANRRGPEASEDPIGGYRARLEATIRRIDEAIPELRSASADLPSRLEGHALEMEGEVASVSIEERVSGDTRQLLRQTGHSVGHIEDFAVVEDELSSMRAAASSRIRRMERRSSSRQRNVPGGTLSARVGIPPGGFPGLYSPGLHLPGGLATPDDSGEPGAPATVGKAKVVQGLLMRVEDKVLGYETGAIAKVVNIPAAATKSMESEFLTRTDETTETETGETSSTEQSVETDERFALQTETENEISLEMSARATGGFSASYGPVSAEGSAEASTAFGMHSATSTASDYAKSVIEKAVSSLVKTKREATKRRRVVELRDLQKEGFDNTDGDDVTSIYQWVDEVHEGRLLNYGSRLMLEFLVPQPGAVLLWSMTSEAAQQDIPQPPPPLDISFDDIEPGGIADLVEEYGATDIPPAPPKYQFVSKVVKVGEGIVERTDTRTNNVLGDETLAIPEGYVADAIWASLRSTRSHDGDRDRYGLEVGGEKFYRLDENRYRFSRADVGGIIPFSGTVPIAITGMENRPATAMVILRCERTDARLDQWRTEVYRVLHQAHQRRVEEYEDKLRMARVRGESGVQGRNPAQNRNIERDEIKRAAISILTAQHYDAFSAVGRRGPLGIPQIRFGEAATEGEYIQFFESAFEWTQTEHVLHPYFWANPAADWLDALRLRMDDPLHEEFLRAGAARVVVPVRPGFEAAVLTYLSHPEGPVLWDGQEYEDIDMDSEMYFPVWRAVMERQGQTESAPIAVGDPWRFRIPTNHQIISGSDQLPAPP
jgi:hypothetical protein